MKNKTKHFFIFILCGSLILLGLSYHCRAGTTLYVDDNGTQMYTTIQAALNDAVSGDTIYVYSGIYNEHFSITTSSLVLTGENMMTTFIDGGLAESVIIIDAPSTTIQGFTIRNSLQAATNYGGISIRSNSNTIQHNNIIDCSNGIHLGKLGSALTGNNIRDNSIYNNHMNGIVLYYDSTGNIITQNSISTNIGDGIALWTAPSNQITNNVITTCDVGIDVLFDSTDQTITGNTINGNVKYGIHLQSDCGSCTIIDNVIEEHPMAALYIQSSGNMIYHNHLRNTYNALDYGSNTWDNGYPSGGNYWSDYQRPDSNHDGIGDTPYIIPNGQNQDHYPLGYFNEPPTANAGGPYSTPVNIGCEFDASQSFDTDGTISGYRWDYDNDGIFDTTWITNPKWVYAYPAAGTYTLHLEVKDDDGATDNATTTITVSSGQGPIADAGGPYHTEKNKPLTVSGSNSRDSDGMITGYRWDMTSDGTFETSWSPSPTYTYTYTTQGTYTVTLEVQDDRGVIDSATATVTVYDYELATLTADAGSHYVGIAGVPLTVNGSASMSSSGPITGYRWDWTNDGIWDTPWFSMATATHVYDTPGTYTLCLEVRDTLMQTTATASVTIITSTSNTKGWIYGTVLDNTSHPVSNVRIATNHSGIMDITDGNGNYLLELPEGFYTLLAEKVGYQNTTATVRVLRNFASSIDFVLLKEDISPPSAVIHCPASGLVNTVFFFDALNSSDNGVIEEYRWDFGDTTAGTGVNITHNYTTVGNYTVTLTVVDSAGNVNSTSTIVMVMPLQATSQTPGFEILVCLFGVLFVLWLKKKKN